LRFEVLTAVLLKIQVSVLGCNTVFMSEWFVTFQKIHLQVSSCAKMLLGLLAVSGQT
jgi:hypothetical protein